MIFDFICRQNSKRWLKKTREEIEQKRDMYLKERISPFEYQEAIAENIHQARVNFTKDKADNIIDWDLSQGYVRMCDFLQELLKELEFVEKKRREDEISSFQHKN